MAPALLPVLASAFGLLAGRPCLAENYGPRAPVFQPAGGLFLSNVSVTITDAAPVLRYTLDGTEPGTNSPLYSGPVLVTNCAVLQARGFGPNGQSGQVAAETYTLIAPDLAAFNSSLPLVVMNTFGVFVPHDSQVPGSIRFIDAGTNGRARLLGPPDFDGRAGFKTRGYSSMRYPKRSYGVEIRAPDGGSLDVAVLGLPEDSDWVLYAPYPDKTLMRDVLAYELSNKMGRWAPRTRFVELFINNGSPRLTADHYAGIYVFEEKVRRGAHRVPVAKLTPRDNAEPEITGGYIFKKDHPEEAGGAAFNFFGRRNPGPFVNPFGFPFGPGGFPADPGSFDQPDPEPVLAGAVLVTTNYTTINNGGRWNAFSVPVAIVTVVRSNVTLQTNVFHVPRLVGGTHGANLVASGEGFVTSQANAFFFVEPKAAKITAEQRAWLTNYLNRFEAALYGSGFRDPTNGYASFIDVDSFIDHHIFVEATKNIDGYRFSTFYHKDRGGRLQMGPVWDWNLSLGNASGKEGYLWNRWYWPLLDDQQYSWFRRLFDDPDFAQRYVDRWAAWRTNVFSTTGICARADQITAQVREAAGRNFTRWPIIGEGIGPEYFTGRTWDEDLRYMKDWITNRLAWMDAQFVAPPVPSIPAGLITVTNALAFSAPTGQVYFAVGEADVRAPGGAVSPSAKIFQTPIPLTNSTTLTLRAKLGNRWSHPVTLRYTVNPAAGGG